MLIECERHTREDLRLWRELEEADMVHGERMIKSGKVDRSLEALSDFIAAGPCYGSASWGKDSVVMAHLAWSIAPSLPLFWVRVEPIAMPYCDAIASEFNRLFPGFAYEEITVHCRKDDGGYHATGTLEKGVREAEKRSASHRHISGVRGDESPDRFLRMCKWGMSSPNTCAPLGWWTANDVYGYAAVHGIPLHPNYAMLGGGRWNRQWLRVASLGGKRGTGMGRAEWEREYYADELRRMNV